MVFSLPANPKPNCMKYFSLLFFSFLLIHVCFAQEPADSATNQQDTFRIGNVRIYKHHKKNKDGNEITMGRKTSRKAYNVSTNWWILDLGISNFDDKTNYSSTNGFLYNRPGTAPIGKSDFSLKNGKSINVNIWAFMQKINLVQHKLNFKYGLGLELNNYRFSSSVSFRQTNPFTPLLAPSPAVFRDSVTFTKNKLAADYLTIPLLLNFTSNNRTDNKGFSASIGISAGYLYSQRNKQSGSPRGKELSKGDLGLEKFKFAFTGDISFGPTRLYASYSPKSMFSNGLDMRPFNIGLRFSNW